MGGRKVFLRLLLLVATWSVCSFGSRSTGWRLEEECALAWKRLAVHREVLPAASSTEEWAQPTTETEPSSPAGLLAGAAMGFCLLQSGLWCHTSSFSVFLDSLLVECVRCSLASVTYKKETISEVSPGTVAQWVFACLTSASVCALLPEKSGVVLRRYIFYLASLAPPHYAMEKEYTLSRMALRCNWTIMPLMWGFCRGMKISLDKWARENELAYLRGEV